MFQKFLQLLFACAILFISANASAQKYAISGKIADAENNQPLFSAVIQAVGTNDGAMSDFDGNYSLELPNGTYKISFSYVGMSETIKEITVAGAAQTLDVALAGNKLLEEVKVVADIAKDRATPVAFSNISTIKLKEELAGQDIPMILNSTPGVYATQGGGGVGDARISIRGFSQRNVAVMLDGIPVNDMENGQVYWSNWFGLENNTKAMQVQRGLGASKLAVPSVGGSINILTKGIDDAKSITLNNELGSGNYVRSTVFANSGRMKGGWGISSAVSFQKQDGIIDQLYSKGFFYYLRIDKQFKKHMLSFSGFGAPQEHGQNSKGGIGLVDSAYANKLYSKPYIKDAINADKHGYGNYGRTFNPSWGRNADASPLNTRVNYYHKPQFSFRHSWQISPKVFLSNIAYLSIGTGGGTSGVNQNGYFFATGRLEDGTVDVPTALSLNNPQLPSFPLGKTNTYIRSSRNDHFWYGLLSTVKYDINKTLSFSGGVDLRDYKGNHFRELYNPLNIGPLKTVIPSTATGVVINKGDAYEYSNTGLVRWGGAFGLLEFNKNKFSGFFNASGAYTGYSLVDHFKPKALIINGEQVIDKIKGPVYLASGGSSAPNKYVLDGVTYTVNSPEAQLQKIDFEYFLSYTFKAGMSYNITKQHGIFANLGWLSRAPRYNNVLLENRNNPAIPITKVKNLQNEDIKAIELGYNFRTPKFSANINGYYTQWRNKPIDAIATVPDVSSPGEFVTATVTGVGALHKGIEMDFAYNITKKITFEGLVSLGDWQWDTKGQSIDPNNSNNVTEFDPRGVKVGDAAQTQFGAAIRYEPIKGLYFKARGTYFGDNYSNFNPEGLTGENAGRQSWKMPDYYLIDCNTGYTFKVDKKIKAGIRFNLLNLTDALYISDAQNNANTATLGVPMSNTYGAESASVSFGLPRRWNMSFTLEF